MGRSNVNAGMMNYSMMIASVIAVCSIAFSCAGSTHTASAQAPQKASAEEALDWSQAVPGRVAGKIEDCADHMLCIVSTPQSRSRVSHYVYGEHRAELEKNYGRYAQVSGRVLPDDKNPFRKYVFVDRIDRISDTPPRGFFR